MPKERLTHHAKDSLFMRYEAAVQNVAFTLRFCEQHFKRKRGRTPLSLREDFAGSAQIAHAFAQRARRAVAVDHDESVLDYGKRHHAKGAGAHVVVADVCTHLNETFDLVLAENFSWGVFHAQSELLRYFENARLSCNDEGALIFDVMAGHDLKKKWRREHDDWAFGERTYDPLTNVGTFVLELFDDDAKGLIDAFVYRWRLYDLAHLRELLLQAGFSEVELLANAKHKKQSYRVCKKFELATIDVRYMIAWV